MPDGGRVARRSPRPRGRTPSLPSRGFAAAGASPPARRLQCAASGSCEYLSILVWLLWRDAGCGCLPPLQAPAPAPRNHACPPPSPYLLHDSDWHIGSDAAPAPARPAKPDGAEAGVAGQGPIALWRSRRFRECSGNGPGNDGCSMALGGQSQQSRYAHLPLSARGERGPGTEPSSTPPPHPHTHTRREPGWPGGDSEPQIPKIVNISTLGSSATMASGNVITRSGFSGHLSAFDPPPPKKSSARRFTVPEPPPPPPPGTCRANFPFQYFKCKCTASVRRCCAFRTVAVGLPHGVGQWR